MTVKELVDKLLQFDQNINVYLKQTRLSDDGGGYDHEHYEEVEPYLVLNTFAGLPRLIIEED